MAPGSLVFACAPPNNPNCMAVSRPHRQLTRKPGLSGFHDAAAAAVRCCRYALSSIRLVKEYRMQLLSALIAAAQLALLGAMASTATAQGQPSRPMRLVVPLAPGGTNDTLGRIVAGPLAERLGQQIVVDNRP